MHPWDAKLLPVLEALLAAGYRPRTFQDVMVSVRGAEPQLRELFDPLDPVQGDAGLDLEANRWARTRHCGWHSIRGSSGKALVSGTTRK